MTQQVTRFNLTGYNFPLLSTGSGKSVIVPSKLDIEPSNARFVPKPEPQLIYCENLLPTAEGYRSCILTAIIAAAANPADVAFEEVYNVAASDGALAWLAPASGSNQLWKGTTWSGMGAYGAGVATTHANITGQSYICWAYTGIKRVNITAGTLSSGTDAGDTLVGITATNIKGICASGNYLIAYAEQTISWSSPTNPMDFTPSLITGAGTATPTDLRGRIIKIVQISTGFLIYTTENVVSVTASGNASYPWVFKPVAESTGLKAGVDSATETVAGNGIAWTLDGLQAISVTGVEPLLPEITDFVASKLLETYDVATGLLTIEKLSTDLVLALHRISKRYLVISYGKTATFTHALVFDTALNRWGKIVTSHVEVVSLPSNQVEADRVICFVSSVGSVVQLSMDATAIEATGVAVFGRFTVTRTSKTTVQEVEIESPSTADVLTCRLGTSYEDGVTQDAIKLLAATTSNTTRKYYTRTTGVAHFLHLAGMLNLTCVTVTSTQDGKR